MRNPKSAFAAWLAAIILLEAPGMRAYAAVASVAAKAGPVAAGVAVPALGVSFGSASRVTLTGATLAPSLAIPSPAVFVAPRAGAPAAAPLAAPIIAPAAAAPPSASAAAAPAAPEAQAAAPSLSVAQQFAAELGKTGESSAGAQQVSGRAFDASLPKASLSDPVPGAPSAGSAPLAKSEEGGSSRSAPPSAPQGPSGKTKLPRSLWGLFWGHHIMTVFGINFHMLSQPFLVMETLGKGKALMGVVRNVHMGSMSLVNLLPIGLLIDKTDFRVLFIATSLFRALMMGAIPLLFISGQLTFGVLVAIVALNPLFQSTMIVADGAARKAFLGTDEKLNKEASATLSKWDSVAGMAMPLIAGWAVGSLVTAFGLGGYAIAYGVYAALLLAAVPVYWFMVRDPRDPAEQGIGGFVEFLKGTGVFVKAVVKGLLWNGPLAVLKALFVSLPKWVWGKLARKAPAAKSAAPAGEKAALKERVARFLDQYEAMKGLAYILRNKTLSVLMMVGAVEAFLADAMPMVVLPNFITDAIGTAPASAVPLIGPLLATAGGIFGVMMAAEYLGRFLSSWKLEGDKGDRLIERWGHGRFYRMAAVASLSFWAMWAFPALLTPGLFWANLGVVLAVQFILQLFHAPVGIVMAPVVRKEIPDKILGRVDSAFNMIDLFMSAGGALLAGLLLDFLPISTAMLVIAVAITGTSVMTWLVPRWIFPDGRHPAKDKPAEKPEGSAWVVPDVAFA